jgi:hypothetical protein
VPAESFVSRWEGRKPCYLRRVAAAKIPTLEISGTNTEDKKIKGTVAMKKTASGWQVLDQSFYFTD